MATKQVKAKSSDENIVAFQKWYNKTYGQPTIATDGMLSVGTQEAYAKNGNDYITYLQKENVKNINTLTASLDKEKNARVAAEYLSANAKQEVEKMKRKFIIGTVGGFALGAIIVGFIKVVRR